MWDRLSSSQKSDIMRMAIQNGIRDLDSIKNIYNRSTSGYNRNVRLFSNGSFMPSIDDDDKGKENSNQSHAQIVRDDTAPMMNNVQVYNGDPASLIDADYQRQRIMGDAVGYTIEFPEDFAIRGKAHNKKVKQRKEREPSPPLPFGGTDYYKSSLVKRKPIIPEFKPVEFNFSSPIEPSPIMMETPYTDRLMGRTHTYDDGGDVNTGNLGAVNSNSIIYNSPKNYDYKVNNIGEVVIPSFNDWSNGNKWNDTAPDWMFKEGYEGPRTFGAVYDNFSSVLGQYNNNRRSEDRRLHPENYPDRNNYFLNQARLDMGLDRLGQGKYAREFAYPLLGAMTLLPTAGAIGAFAGGAGLLGAGTGASSSSLGGASLDSFLTDYALQKAGQAAGWIGNKAIPWLMKGPVMGYLGQGVINEGSKLATGKNFSQLAGDFAEGLGVDRSYGEVAGDYLNPGWFVGANNIYNTVKNAWNPYKGGVPASTQAATDIMGISKGGNVSNSSGSSKTAQEIADIQRKRATAKGVDWEAKTFDKLDTWEKKKEFFDVWASNLTDDEYRLLRHTDNGWVGTAELMDIFFNESPNTILKRYANRPEYNTIKKIIKDKIRMDFHNMTPHAVSPATASKNNLIPYAYTDPDNLSIMDRMEMGIGMFDTSPEAREIIKHHEMGHAIYEPFEPIPEGVVKDIGDYGSRDNNDEWAKRIAQIFNEEGITGTEPVTGDWLNKTWKKYIDNKVFNNDMEEFYNAVDDWNGLADWASKKDPKTGRWNVVNYAVPAGVAAGLGAAWSAGNNNENTNNVRAYGGYLFKKGGKMSKDDKDNKNPGDGDPPEGYNPPVQWLNPFVQAYNEYSGMHDPTKKVYPRHVTLDPVTIIGKKPKRVKEKEVERGASNEYSAKDAVDYNRNHKSIEYRDAIGGGESMPQRTYVTQKDLEGRVQLQDKAGRKIASGLSTIGGIIGVFAPPVGAVLSIPDLMYDGMDLLRSKNTEEYIVNGIHTALDFPNLVPVKNWDDTVNAAGIIDDAFGTFGEDPIEAGVNYVYPK